MKVVFMGSPDFSVPSLLSLLKSNHDVIAVYTREPKPSGRGQKITKTPVHIVAEDNNITVYNPKTLRSQEEYGKFVKLNPDIAVVVAYGLILPLNILSVPKYGCINLHPSLLPKWRGPSPIQYSILSGDNITGVTIMQMNEHLDSGDILMQKTVEITEDSNVCTMHNKLANLGSDMIVEVLSNIDNITPIVQNDAEASYTKKILNYRIDWNCNAESICRQIRAFYPKSFFIYNDKRIRILQATWYYLEVDTSIPGVIINNDFHIKCGENTVLVPQIIQVEGKKHCDIKNFVSNLPDMSNCNYNVL